MLCSWTMARRNIFRLCLSLQMQSLTKVWFALVWSQLRLRGVFNVSVFALIGTLTWRSRCRKLSVLALSTCATLIDLAAFFPEEIASRLDYCNARLYGKSWQVNIARLQRIHNTARQCRTLVTLTPRHNHCVQSWFQTNCIHLQSHANDAPVYLCEVVCSYQYRGVAYGYDRDTLTGRKN